MNCENISLWKARSMAKNVFCRYQFGRMIHWNFRGECTQKQLLTRYWQSAARCRSTTVHYYGLPFLGFPSCSTGGATEAALMNSTRAYAPEHKRPYQVEISSKVGRKTQMFLQPVDLQPTSPVSDWSSAEKLMLKLVAVTDLHQKCGVKKMKSPSTYWR